MLRQTYAHAQRFWGRGMGGVFCQFLLIVTFCAIPHTAAENQPLPPPDLGPGFQEHSGERLLQFISLF